MMNVEKFKKNLYILKEIAFKRLNMHFFQLCCILFNFVLIIKAKLL